jgi:hypothetical protein
VPLPQLVPLPVAWMVSPSVPFLELRASEDPIRTPTAVSLFGTHLDGASSRVTLVFDAALWARMCPSYSDGEVVPEGDYDWSGVPQLSTGSDFRESVSRRRSRWLETGLCPDPRAYEVTFSPWLAQLRFTTVQGQSLRHYLVLGHDVYVEVLATSWRDEDLT